MTDAATRLQLDRFHDWIRIGVGFDCVFTLETLGSLHCMHAPLCDHLCVSHRSANLRSDAYCHTSESMEQLGEVIRISLFVNSSAFQE